MPTKSSISTSDSPAHRGEWWSSLNAFQILLLFVAGIMLLILGIHLEEGIRGHAAWRRYEAEATQRGVKLTFADYIPPKIPDAENFASVPIFDAIFRATEAKQAFSDPFVTSHKWSSTPPLSDSGKQARVDLGEWQAHLVKNKLLPAPGNNAAADVLRALDHFAEPLAQLHAAGARPYCRFPVHWEEGTEAYQPHWWTTLDSAAGLFALRLEAHLARGDGAAAYEDFHDGWRLITATRQEPSAYAGKRRTTMAITMENAVWSGLAAHQWAEPELRKIEADFAALDWLKDYLFTINSERAAFNLTADKLIARPQLLAEVMFMHGTRHIPPLQEKLAFMLYPAGWTYQNKVRANHYIDELSARIDPAQHRWFSERPRPSAAGNIRSAPGMLYYFAFSMFGQELEGAEQRYLYVATLTDGARLACALERFRLARGSYPATLAALAPEFTTSVPTEIVNGQPYHYRVTEDGSFVLYSVGMNLIDDGGAINPMMRGQSQSDWVWRYPAKAGR